MSLRNDVQKCLNFQVHFFYSEKMFKSGQGMRWSWVVMQSTSKLPVSIPILFFKSSTTLFLWVKKRKAWAYDADHHSNHTMKPIDFFFLSTFSLTRLMRVVARGYLFPVCTEQPRLHFISSGQYRKHRIDSLSSFKRRHQPRRELNVDILVPKMSSLSVEF